MPVQPRKGRAATRILVRAQKGGRTPLTIVPALILHEGERFTAESDALHRGAALINW
jgi:tRNA1(Val) A37 N6-methylase TrmN6